MRDERRQRFAPYARQMADLMGLKDWAFAIKDYPPDDGDALASVYCVYGQKHANIYLADAFLDEDPEEQRWVVCHELIHCHFHQAGCVAEEGLEKGVHKAFVRDFEYGVDGMARAFAQFLPLPDPADPGPISRNGDRPTLPPEVVAGGRYLG